MASRFQSYRIVNGKPISDDAFYALAASGPLIAAVTGKSRGETPQDFKMALPSGMFSLQENLVESPLREGGSNVNGFREVKIGEPVHIFLRELYLGDQPDVWAIDFDKTRNMIVTSKIKNLPLSSGAARAIHMIKPVRKGERIRVNVNTGSPILYHQKALMSLNVGIELSVSFDNNPDDFFQGISTLLSSAAALPLFVPAAPSLIAASGLVSIGSKIAESLVDSGPDITFDATEFSMGLVGSLPVEAGYRVLCRPRETARLFRDHRVNDAGSLVRNDDPSVLYEGPIPYAVIALDSKPVELLDVSGFEPLLATADLLAGAESPKGFSAQFIESIAELANLSNDEHYGKKAMEYASLAGSVADVTLKQKYEALRDAALKNISNADRRKWFGGA